MPFQYVLANLLATSPDALGVVFLDDAGETVELASAEYSLEDLKVLGAYLGIYLRQLEDILDDSLGVPRAIQIDHDDVHVQVMTLPDGYCLALVLRAPAQVSASRRSLEKAAAELEREVFGEPQ